MAKEPARQVKQPVLDENKLNENEKHEYNELLDHWSKKVGGLDKVITTS